MELPKLNNTENSGSNSKSNSGSNFHSGSDSGSDSDKLEVRLESQVEGQVDDDQNGPFCREIVFMALIPITIILTMITSAQTYHTLRYYDEVIYMTLYALLALIFVVDLLIRAIFSTVTKNEFYDKIKKYEKQYHLLKWNISMIVHYIFMDKVSSKIDDMGDTHFRNLFAAVSLPFGLFSVIAVSMYLIYKLGYKFTMFCIHKFNRCCGRFETL